MNLDQRIAVNVLKRIAEFAENSTLRSAEISIHTNVHAPQALTLHYVVRAIDDDGIEKIVIFDPKRSSQYPRPSNGAVGADE
jgi:hypothetical protein